MLLNKAKAWLVGLACAASPLVTTANCDSGRGTFDFFRGGDHHDSSFLDIFIEDDYYYGDDCFFDDCWVEEIIIYD